MKSYSNIFLGILSAVLLIYSFPATNFWFLGWIALTPFLLTAKEEKLLNVILIGFLTGLVFYYGCIYWLNYISGFGTIALVFYLSLYFLIFSFFTAIFIKSSLPVFIKGISIASVWVILEYIRSNFLTTLGFGWVSLGYSQADFLPIIQIADITGVYGISFLLIFANVMITELFFSENKNDGIEKEKIIARLLRNKLLNLFFLLLLIGGVLSYGFNRLTSEQKDSKKQSYKISLIQPNIPQSLKWDDSYKQDILEKHLRLTAEAKNNDQSELVIWPETSYPADLEREQEFSSMLFDSIRKINTYVLIGCNRFIWLNEYNYNTVYNSALLISPEGKVVNFYDKMHLVPFGEYFPVEKLPKILFKILPERINMVGDFSAGKDYKVFKVIFSPERQLNFGVLICFEDLFPEMARNFVKNGAQVLVNITNDAWYGVSSAPYQHAQASILRAVENRIPVVRAANTGLSVFIDEKGRVFEKIMDKDKKDIFVEGYKTALVSIQSKPAKTFYNKYGDVFFGLVTIFFILGIFTLFQSKLNRY